MEGMTWLGNFSIGAFFMHNEKPCLHVYIF